MFASIPQKGLWFLGGGLWQNQIYSKYKALRRANWASSGSGIARPAASSNSSELKEQITAHDPGATHPDRRRPSRTRELVPRALARKDLQVSWLVANGTIGGHNRAVAAALSYWRRRIPLSGNQRSNPLTNDPRKHFLFSPGHYPNFQADGTIANVQHTALCRPEMAPHFGILSLYAGAVPARLVLGRFAPQSALSGRGAVARDERTGNYSTGRRSASHADARAIASCGSVGAPFVSLIRH
jgi:hypothetical protein